MNTEHKPGTNDQGPAHTPEPEADTSQEPQAQAQREIGGPRGLEPTRYGDWEKGGRCIDF